jgi:hypothetical protein
MHPSQIQDDLGDRRPSYSFLSHPANRLQDSFRVLSRRAFSQKGGFSNSHACIKADEYLRSCDELTQYLYGGIVLTSGMLGRYEELRMIRWANTRAVARNAVFYRGNLILIFSYNKASTNHNNSFYVVRMPCSAIQRVLFVYLTYIRPFRDFLARMLQRITSPSTNPHIFTLHDDDSSFFSAKRCRKSLSISTRNSPIEINTQVYRQIAISIVKKHLTSLTKSFDVSSPSDHEGILKLFAW